MARVLVVDDNLLIRTLLREILVTGGHDVVAEAGDGRAAVAHAEAASPDLITLDLVMPGPDGIEVLAQLRDRDPGVLVIICSAWLTAPRVTRALRLGAKGFIAKPFDHATVLSTVDSVLVEAGTHPDEDEPPASAVVPDLGAAPRDDERREFDRVDVALRVVLRCTDDVRIDAWTVDLSGGGMRVRAAGLVPQSHCRFELTLEPGLPPVGGDARVVRASPTEGCALAFERVHAPDHGRLINYLRRQRSATARLLSSQAPEGRPPGDSPDH